MNAPITVDELDLRYAMRWIAQNLLRRAEQKEKILKEKPPKTHLLIHGLRVPLTTFYGKKIYVEFVLKVASHPKALNVNVVVEAGGK